MESDMYKLKEFHEQDMKAYRAKIEAHIDLLKQEIDGYKQKINQMKDENEKNKINYENRIEKMEIILK